MPGDVLKFIFSLGFIMFHNNTEQCTAIYLPGCMNVSYQWKGRGELIVHRATVIHDLLVGNSL